MANYKHDKGPKQTTRKGHEIPVPKKTDVLRDLTKVAKPPKKRP